MFPSLAFHSPHALWLLLAVPLIFWAAWRERQTRAVLRFPVAGVFSRARRGPRSYLLAALPLARAACVMFAIIALARPQTRDTRVRNDAVEGIDVVIALDLSTSMEAGDFRPQNRLHVAKQVLIDFITKRVNDRIGLVVFAGAAYTQAPLTLDYGVLKEIVGQLRTRVLEDGTAIGDALATSLNRLRDSDAKSRVVVLITDGDNNAGMLSPSDSATMAKTLGIPVFTILVGRGGKVPFPAGEDLFGNPVWREMEIPINPELLESIADQTGGEYYRATDRESLELGLQKVLDTLERSRLVDGSASAAWNEEFHPFLLAAFLLAALELLARSTILRVFP